MAEVTTFPEASACLDLITGAFDGILHRAGYRNWHGECRRLKDGGVEITARKRHVSLPMWSVVLHDPTICDSANYADQVGRAAAEKLLTDIGSLRPESAAWRLDT